MQNKIIKLSKGAEGLFIENNRFNTTLISFNFYLPLEKRSVAEFALLPFILTSCSKAYPDFSRLNYKLNKLYGARLDAGTEKFGDYQRLTMTVSVINDKFTLDGEKLCLEAVNLLLGLVFEPNVENGAFSEADLAREKRKAIEHIKGEYSEKRVYAKKRLIEEMYNGQTYGIPKCGTVKDVEAVTGETLYKAWTKMLKTAFIRVQVVGAQLPSGIFEKISERLSLIERENTVNCKNSRPTEAPLEVKTVVDYDDVSQGKLCMGFASDLYGNDDLSLPLLVMGDIFGGGPYSKLFSNVREKLSLCYYCSASSVRQKGLLTVESGVETANCKKAEEAILAELEALKQGDFSDFELEASIKSICDSLMTYNDSLNALDMWYALKVCNDEVYSPSDIAQRVADIKREDIIKTAKGINLHTVYKLLPKEENQ